LKLLDWFENGTYRLPEGKKDNQLDAKDFDEWLMLCNVGLGLEIELDQAVHGNSDRYRLNNKDLFHCDEGFNLLPRSLEVRLTQTCANAILSESSQ
jgi:hypothetical protein